MFGVILAMLRSLGAAFQPRSGLLLENLALRHQLVVLQRNARKANFRNPDRLLWILLRAVWSGWEKALVIVRPQTVVGWHRAGFRLYWRWKSRGRGRPSIDWELIGLIRRMWDANPTWGSPRIRDELAKLGIRVSDSTIRKYRPKRPRPSSQNWTTFLRNHAKEIVAIDFFTIPTATFRVLFVFVVLAHERRKVVHFAVSESPSAGWTGQQLVNAFPFEMAPKYLRRDRDGIYGTEFVRRVAGLGMEDKPIAPRSPWQNPYVERLIGSLRRECLDHVIIFNERHLQHVLREYLDYYHGSRTHRGLERDCPVARQVERVESGQVIEFSVLGGLHHRYTRRAA
jgi:transposase InsO family protein